MHHSKTMIQFIDPICGSNLSASQPGTRPASWPPTQQGLSTSRPSSQPGAGQPPSHGWPAGGLAWSTADGFSTTYLATAAHSLPPRRLLGRLAGLLATVCRPGLRLAGLIGTCQLVAFLDLLTEKVAKQSWIHRIWGPPDTNHLLDRITNSSDH